MVINGQITGAGKLFVYERVGGIENLTLTSGANDWTGGMEIERGSVRLGSTGTLGSGAVTIDSGAMLGVWAPTAVTLANNFVLNSMGLAQNLGAINHDGGAGLVTLNGSITLASDSRIGVGGVSWNQMLINGQITGAGKLFVYENLYPGLRLTNGANNWSGGTEIENGRMDVTASGALSSGTVTVDSNATVTVWAVTNPVTLANNFVLNSMGLETNRGAINHDGGSGLVTLTGTITLATDSRIGCGGASWNNMLVSGQITGPGKLSIYESTTSVDETLPPPWTNLVSTVLTLTGANNYSGGTEIENGIVNVQNTSGSGTGSGAVTVKSGAALGANGIISGAITVQSGGGLGGKGIISGAVTVNSGGTLAPGNFDIGRLTINNTLTLDAGSLTVMEINKTAGTNDSAAGLTAVNYDGTLTVTNLGGTFVGGENYQLFSATSYNGNFSATNLPALDPGLKWVWTPTTGTLSTTASYATTSTNISYSVSGSTLTLTWPGSHLGWYAQSNSVNVADTSYWFNIAGSETATNLIITIDPAAPKVFYRLKMP
jgi:fibronectin-binding autotransporter adhesin